MSEKRFGRRYLARRSLDEARQLLFAAADRLRPETERIPTADGLGRVTAAAVPARHAAPFYHSSAMDGVAVRAADTTGATEKTPCRLRLGEDAVWVDTGDPVPPDRDAVVMSEDIHYRSDDEIEIHRPSAPGDHVRVTGQEIATGEMVVPSGWAIGPADMGALLSAGVTEIDVVGRPKVVILPTGSEMILPGEPLEHGKVVEFNSQVTAALVTEAGGEPEVGGLVPDDRGALATAIQEAAARADVVVVLAGSSAGTEDFTPRAIGDEGTLLVHGVNIAPGKPTALGVVGGQPVVGLPGYPVAAALSARLFLQPLLRRMTGLPEPVPESMTATLPKALPSKLGAREFLRVRLGRIGDTTYAYPLPRGSAAILSYSKAQGLLQVPEESEGLPAGEEMPIELLRGTPDLEKTIVLSGSHDLLIDILEDELRQKGITLLASAVGSLGGILALRDGIAHLATSHLLDAESGEYNGPFIKRYLKNRAARRVPVVYRQQGLIVAAGNPKNLAGWKDLGRDDVTFVNRQKGSGSRVLLDYRLAEAAVAPEQVRGYNREEYTHWAVAMDVESGLVDTGLGISSAATTLNLGFVPLEEEEFDLIIPEEHEDLPAMKILLETLGEETFQKRVLELGGYRFRT